MPYIIGILVVISLIFYGIDSLKEAVVNTSKAVKGEKKIDKKSVQTWLNLITIVIIIMMCIWQKEYAQFLRQIF